MTWRAQASCSDEDPKVWLPGVSWNRVGPHHRRMCQSCPVLAVCFVDSLINLNNPMIAARLSGPDRARMWAAWSAGGMGAAVRVLTDAGWPVVEARRSLNNLHQHG